MEYKLDCGILNGIFAVPNSVVDNYIKLANEAAIKVLLYVLRHGGENLSSKRIAAALNLTEDRVEEAFVFWGNANIFTGKAETASEPSSADPAPCPEINQAAKKKTIVPDRSQYNISPSEIAEKIESSEKMKDFFITAESIFGEPMNHTQQRSFIHLLEYLDISAEVLLMIIAYAVKSSKKSVKYIEKVAYDFMDRGINTLELAQKEIKILEEKNSYIGKIKSIFGINTNFSTKQKNIVNDWLKKSVDIEMVKCAFDVTIDHGMGANIPYANGILKNWENDGITTPEQVIKENKKQLKPIGDYSFDIKDLMSMANNFGE